MVVELVDTLDLKSNETLNGRAGSSSVCGNKPCIVVTVVQGFFIVYEIPKLTSLPDRVKGLYFVTCDKSVVDLLELKIAF